jgi:hypothetical protein
VVGSLLDLLGERERDASARVVALEEQIAVLSGDLLVAREAVSRLRITAETVAEVLAGQPEAASSPVSPAAMPSGDGAVLLVPFRAEGAGVSVLPQGYRDVLEAVADAGRPVRAGEISVALGLGSRASQREGMRSKCRRLVERGWLVADREGLFVLAGGVSGRTDGSGS